MDKGIGTKTDNGIKITRRDRVFRAWEDSMELVRNYEIWAKEIDDKAISGIFAKFAEDECIHAAKFLDLLHEME
ncbi:MAG: rubrerythrin [Eubacteriales bacterium]